MGNLMRANPTRGAVAFVAALAIVAGFIFIFASPGARPAPADARATVSPAGASTLTIIHEIGSYAVGYVTLRDLRDASDLVVVGMVGTSSASSDRSAPGPGISTRFVVGVEKVVAAKPGVNAQGGTALRPGASIVVAQSGGASGNTELINDDDPLMRQGDQVVLFLRQVGPGAYEMLEPGGHYIVDAQGIVHPANSTLSVDTQQNLTLAQFLAQLDAA